MQEQLGHAGGRVLLPALGLRRGTALRQPVAVGRVACGPPQRLQGFWLSLAPFGGGRFTCGRLTLRGLRGGWIQQRWAWGELLLVPTEGSGECHAPLACAIFAKPRGALECPPSDRTENTLSTPLQEGYKHALPSVPKQVLS